MKTKIISKLFRKLENFLFETPKIAYRNTISLDQPKAVNQTAEQKNTEQSKRSKFQVFVDDNFHYMEEDERYFADGFDEADEAILYCKKIVDDFLISQYKRGMKAEVLYDYYIGFGEDPFIRCKYPFSKIHFSAWDYAKMRSFELCKDNLI